jgi:flavin-dependent dehydrogenase
VFDDVRLEGPPRLHCLVDPAIAPGYIAWVAWDGERVHVGAGGHAGAFQPDAALQSTKQFMTGALRRFGVLAEVIDLGHQQPAERRRGPIPVGGVLPSIVNARGLLVGDAAGAASPLTAGGLDPCLRMSPLAATCVQRFLAGGDAGALAPYDGRRFRARFTSRLLLRRAFDAVQSPRVVEALLFGARLPGGGAVTRSVFFGSGSFPDVMAGGPRRRGRPGTVAALRASNAQRR